MGREPFARVSAPRQSRANRVIDSLRSRGPEGDRHQGGDGTVIAHTARPSRRAHSRCALTLGLTWERLREVWLDK